MATIARRYLWIERLEGEAHSYARDYLGWWLEGGREPEVERYIGEDDPSFNSSIAQRIAARVRAENR